MVSVSPSCVYCLLLRRNFLRFFPTLFEMPIPVDSLNVILSHRLHKSILHALGSSWIPMSLGERGVQCAVVFMTRRVSRFLATLDARCTYVCHVDTCDTKQSL